MNEPLLDQFDAEYTLEAPASCPHCEQEIETLLVIRLLRTRVNFTSALPRRGQVLICSKCRAVVAGGLGGLI